MSTPASPQQQHLSPAHSLTPVGSERSSSSYPVTRTVAIIKPHALRHRFDIERRIQEASFEIVKERQMEFDTETDPDTLFELFGEDAASFSEGPVWVYVLERRRAVEVWNTVMGDCDPDFARKETPTALRALYGTSIQQNGLMGSPDVHTAEMQIASLFASSPIFPTSELPDDRFGTLNSVSSSVLEELKKQAYEESGSIATNPSTAGESGGSGSHRLNGNGTTGFRARAIPSTNAAPDIIPRMTRSAALRQGVVVEKKESGPRSPLTKERLAKTFANVPGHKRAEVIQVASTAAPVIAPRMTRAASLRLGMKPDEPARRRTMSTEDIKATFVGVPGHKRRESIAVASTKPPSVAPRLNKSASLRQSKEQAPPTSFMFRDATVPKQPASLSRSTSSAVTKSTPPAQSRPSIIPPRPSTVRRPSLQTAPVPVSRYAIPRASSVIGQRPTSTTPGDLEKKENGAAPILKRRASVTAPPSIAPRTNRSAALRAAKMEAESAAAAAAAAKKHVRPRVAPSSFKPIAAV